MDDLHPRRSIFGGHASGVSAHIRRPVTLLLPVQGCSSLPVIGGVSESKVGPGSLDEFVKFDAVATSARGDYVNPAEGVATTTGAVAFDAVPTRTTVQSDVVGLIILDRVKVDRAAICLIAEYNPTGEPPTVTLENNVLEGVSIDGYRLAITLDEEFYQVCNTTRKLAAAYSAGLPKDRAHLLLPLDGSAPPAATFPEANGTVKCTIVKEIRWEGDPHPTATIHGHVVRVPDFGKIYFGELYIMGNSRRLTMVRFQLGSPQGGELMAAEGEINPNLWPPG